MTAHTAARRAVVVAMLAALAVAAGAAPRLSTTTRKLYVRNSYGTHVIGDLTGNGLRDLVFLTQLGEGNEPGVLSIFLQERRRQFSDLRRFQTPPGTREVQIADIDGDGANELLLITAKGLSRMNFAGGELQRDVVEVPFAWPPEVGNPILLTAQWRALRPGEPPALLLSSIGLIGVFEWKDAAYAPIALLRTDASAFNFSATMGTFAARLGNIRRDESSLGASVDGRRFMLVLPSLYLTDMDADGDTDIAICRPSRGQVAVHLNPGDGRFPAEPSATVHRSRVNEEEALVGWVSETVSLDDLNGDRLPDLLVIKRGSRESREITQRSVYFATAAMAYPDEPDALLTVDTFATQTALRDLNADGRVDMIFPVAKLNISSLLTTGLTGDFKYVIRFHLQPEEGGFALRPDYQLSFDADLSSLQDTNGPFYTFDYDFTGDGVRDLAIVNDRENLEVHECDERGRISGRTAANLVIERGEISIFDDLDGDGMADFLNLKQRESALDFDFVIDFIDRAR